MKRFAFGVDNQPSMSVWHGRIDDEENSLRWHQVIQLIDPDSPPGVVILGFASDTGVERNQGRVGSREGSEALRRALANLPYACFGPIYDCGDISCEDGHLEEAQERLAVSVGSLLEAGHFPIVLGGGHEIALGSWSGLARYLEPRSSAEEAPSVGIINFDAHFDLRQPSKGVASSGTPFYQIAELSKSKGWSFEYACLGVSRASNTRVLFERAGALGALVHEDREMTLDNLRSLRHSLENFIKRCDHLYLSIDMDVFPASQVPGVSAPAARGVGLEVIEPLLETIVGSQKLRLIDLAELNPRYDLDSRSARVAARLIFQLSQAISIATTQSPSEVTSG